MGLVLGASGFFFIPKLINYLPNNQVQKIGIVGQFTTSELPNEILTAISHGLTRVNEKGEVEPFLAESWQINNADQTYVFEVNPNNGFWHDAKPFLPSDINYNFKDITFLIEGNKITFNLKEPFAPFPIILAKPLFKKGLVGLGQYKVGKIEKAGDWVKSILLQPVKAGLPAKLYRVYASEKDLKTGFNLGEVEIANLYNVDGLYLSPTIEVQEKVMKNTYVGVFFDTAKTPFSSKTFRQALAYAIPKENGEKRALGPLNPTSWAYNPDVKKYYEDLTHAQELFTKEKGDGEILPIIITVFPQFEQTAIMVKNSWEKLGLTVEIKISTFLPDDFQVLIAAREIPEDPDQYYFWHSSQAGNIGHFKNHRINKLLEDGRKISNKEERKSIYFDYQRFLVEESPVVFLYHSTAYTVVRQ